MSTYKGPTTHEDVPQFLITGNAGADAVYEFTKSAMPDIDSKGKANKFRFDVGGGAGNYAVVLQMLAEKLNLKIQSKFFTRIGKEGNELETMIPHLIVTKKLEQYGIEHIDVSDGNNRLAMNAVSEHNDGREPFGETLQIPQHI